MLIMAVAWSSSGDVAIRYVFSGKLYLASNPMADCCGSAFVPLTDIAT